MLDLEPSDTLRFTGPFTRPVSTQLTITNNNNIPMLFKIKTTAPKLYCVRPNRGSLRVEESKIIDICLQMYEKDKHKFLVLSAPLPAGDFNNFQEMWDRALELNEPFKAKLKCVFIMPEAACLLPKDSTDSWPVSDPHVKSRNDRSSPSKPPASSSRTAGKNAGPSTSETAGARPKPKVSEVTTQSGSASDTTKRSESATKTSHSPAAGTVKPRSSVESRISDKNADKSAKSNLKIQPGDRSSLSEISSIENNIAMLDRLEKEQEEGLLQTSASTIDRKGAGAPRKDAKDEQDAHALGEHRSTADIRGSFASEVPGTSAAAGSTKTAATSKSATRTADKDFKPSSSTDSDPDGTAVTTIKGSPKTRPTDKKVRKGSFIDSYPAGTDVTIEEGRLETRATDKQPALETSSDFFQMEKGEAPGTSGVKTPGTEKKLGKTSSTDSSPDRTARAAETSGQKASPTDKKLRSESSNDSYRTSFGIPAGGSSPKSPTVGAAGTSGVPARPNDKQVGKRTSVDSQEVAAESTGDQRGRPTDKQLGKRTSINSQAGVAGVAVARSQKGRPTDKQLGKTTSIDSQAGAAGAAGKSGQRGQPTDRHHGKRTSIDSQAGAAGAAGASGQRGRQNDKQLGKKTSIDSQAGAVGATSATGQRVQPADKQLRKETSFASQAGPVVAAGASDLRARPTDKQLAKASSSDSYPPVTGGAAGSRSLRTRSSYKQPVEPISVDYQATATAEAAGGASKTHAPDITSGRPKSNDPHRTDTATATAPVRPSPLDEIAIISAQPGTTQSGVADAGAAGVRDIRSMPADPHRTVQSDSDSKGAGRTVTDRRVFGSRGIEPSSTVQVTTGPGINQGSAQSGSDSDQRRNLAASRPQGDSGQHTTTAQRPLSTQATAGRHYSADSYPQAQAPINTTSSKSPTPQQSKQPAQASVLQQSALPHATAAGITPINAERMNKEISSLRNQNDLLKRENQLMQEQVRKLNANLRRAAPVNYTGPITRIDMHTFHLFIALFSGLVGFLIGKYSM